MCMTQFKYQPLPISYHCFAVRAADLLPALYYEIFMSLYRVFISGII